MDEKRDETETETELEGDLAIDDETAAEVTGGLKVGREHAYRGNKVTRGEKFAGRG